MDFEARSRWAGTVVPRLAAWSVAVVREPASGQVTRDTVSPLATLLAAECAGAVAGGPARGGSAMTGRYSVAPGREATLALDETGAHDGHGTKVARIATTQPITHSVVVSPDGWFAFVTNEAIGGTRGRVDVIDLERMPRVASAEVEHQPGGIGGALR